MRNRVIDNPQGEMCEYKMPLVVGGCAELDQSVGTAMRIPAIYVVDMEFNEFASRCGAIPALAYAAKPRKPYLCLYQKWGDVQSPEWYFMALTERAAGHESETIDIASEHKQISEIISI